MPSKQGQTVYIGAKQLIKWKEDKRQTSERSLPSKQGQTVYGCEAIDQMERRVKDRLKRTRSKQRQTVCRRGGNGKKIKRQT